MGREGKTGLRIQVFLGEKSQIKRAARNVIKAQRQFLKVLFRLSFGLLCLNASNSDGQIPLGTRLKKKKLIIEVPLEDVKENPGSPARKADGWLTVGLVCGITYGSQTVRL